MAPKYERVDAELFTWLHSNREEVTTATAIAALGVDDPTTQRHISRRFTQLEDRGVLKCTLKGTTRVCTVELDPPTTMARKKWRQNTPPAEYTPAPISALHATNSEEFLAKGGTIEKLPSHWDKPATCKGIGIMTFDDLISTLD